MVPFREDLWHVRFTVKFFSSHRVRERIVTVVVIQVCVYLDIMIVKR